jgi:hypothetical protein
MATPSIFLGNPPPDAPQNSEAYQSWLRNRSDVPQAQPLGNFDHDAFIAAQFTEADKISSKNPWVEAMKVKKMRKNARSARNKAERRVAEKDSKGLATAHAVLKKAAAEDMKVRKQKKVARRRKTGTAAKLLDSGDLCSRKEDSVMAQDEDSQFEWEDVALPRAAGKTEDTDELEKLTQDELDRDAEEEAAAAEVQAERRKTEWKNGGFGGEVPRISEFDRRMARMYD